MNCETHWSTTISIRMKRVALTALSLMITNVACFASSPKRLTSQQGSYELEVIADGVPIQPYAFRGQHYVAGQIGERYVLRVHNRSGVRVEVVATVDGLDVIDGKRGDYKKRGYIVSPWGYVDIDGWRRSADHVAAFRFSSVASSYAGRKKQDRNVGVIGVAVFPERRYHHHRPHVRRPMRHDRYADRGVRRRQSKSSGPASGEAESMMDSDTSSSGAANRSMRSSRSTRPGLGTEFGERRYSSSYEVSFKRAHRSPAVTLGLTYNTPQGLASMGIPVWCDDECGSHGRDSWCRQSARPFRQSPPSPARRDYAQPPIR